MSQMYGRATTSRQMANLPRDDRAVSTSTTRVFRIAGDVTPVTLPAVAAAQAFTTTIGDPLSEVTNATTVTVQSSGYYHASLSLYVQDAGTAATITARISTGAEPNSGTISGAATVGAGIISSQLLFIEAGTAVQALVSSNTGDATARVLFNLIWAADDQ